jgi:replication factor C subunit 3/5
MEGENIPWTEKYRPSHPDMVLSHKLIKNSVGLFFESKKLPNLLFVGSAGTGKTTLITAHAKQFYKEKYSNMVLSINASEDRGINIIRGKIQSFAMSGNENIFKLIILDEFDSMTDEAQYVLSSVMDKYNKNVRFCLLCNFLKKINKCVQSRCVVYKFNPISYDYLLYVGFQIIHSQKIQTTLKSLKLIISYSNGDMRKLINTLQSIQLNNTRTLKETSSLLIMPTKHKILKLLNFYKSHSLIESINYTKYLVEIYDYSLNEIIKQFYNIYVESIIMNDNVKKGMVIIKKLGEINEQLFYCNSENIQLYGLVSIFFI